MWNIGSSFFSFINCEHMKIIIDAHQHAYTCQLGSRAVVAYIAALLVKHGDQVTRRPPRQLLDLARHHDLMIRMQVGYFFDQLINYDNMTLQFISLPKLFTYNIILVHFINFFQIDVHQLAQQFLASAAAGALGCCCMQYRSKYSYI